MKKQLILAAILCAIPSFAQDTKGTRISLFGDFLLPQKQFDVEPRSNYSLGIRFGFDAARLESGVVDVDLSYRSRTSSALDYKGKNAQGQEVTIKMGPGYYQEYWALGANYNLKLPIDLGFGAEIRVDRLGGKGIPDAITKVAGEDVQSVYIRPWIKGHLGFHFKGESVQPFVRVDAGVALSKQKADNSAAERQADGSLLIKDGEAWLRTLAPWWFVQLHAGIRF